jgi:hypothetical protein
LRSVQIQTLNLSYYFAYFQNLNRQRGFPKPAQRPNQPYRPSGPRSTAAQPVGVLLLLSFSLADWCGRPVSHLFLISLTFFLSAVSAWSPALARTRALDGTVARPANRDAESPHVRAGWYQPEGDFTHLPLRRALLRLGMRGGGGCQLGCPGGQTGGRTGLSRRLSRCRGTNPGGGRNPRCPSHQPHWGFRFFLLQCVCRERRGEGALPLRCAEEEQEGRRATTGAPLLGTAMDMRGRTSRHEEGRSRSRRGRSRAGVKAPS